MSKINDELIGAQNAVRDVADKALKRISNTDILSICFPAIEKSIGDDKSRFTIAVENILKEQNHPEKNNNFIRQVAYTWLIDEDRREEGIEENLELEEEMKRDEEFYG